MLLSVSIFTAGISTVGLGVAGFFFTKFESPEKTFPVTRPRWVTGFCWLYLTLALTGWVGFFQSIQPLSLVIAAILTLTAAKFYFLYFFYSDMKDFLILIWQKRSARGVVSGCAIAVGAIMIFTAKLGI